MEKQAHVIGLGKSDIAAARLLTQQGWQVVLRDRNTAPLLADAIPDLRAEGVTVQLGHSFSARFCDLKTQNSKPLPYLNHGNFHN